MFSHLLAVACLVPGLLAGVISSSSSSSSPRVTVKNGTYVGFNDPVLHTDNFYGVAYAQPPIGDLRFRHPQSLNSSWSGDRVVVDYPKECIASNYNANMSEDCLYMGIIRPSNVTAKNLPVMVYLDQGGFDNGGVGFFPAFNQTWIVQRSADIGYPILGVSVNSRLGPWGFMYSQEIQDQLETNLGLRDMRKALEWIQENIAAFGGDPSRVTIQGQSTGAQSVGLQILAYGGDNANLFQGAISESGAPVWYAPTADVALWQPTYDGIVDAAGCSGAANNLQCLREVSNTTLISIFANSTLDPFGSNAPREFMMAVDGDFIPAPNSELLQSGRFARVPYLIGTNFDEGTTVGPHGVNNGSDLNAYLVDEMMVIDDASLNTIGYLYPDIPEIGIPTTYHGRPPSSVGTQYKRSCAVATDIIMDAPTRLTTLSMASFNSTVWRYHFNVVPNGYSDLQGATHAAEVPLTFYDQSGTAYDDNPLGGTNGPKLLEMAKIMSAMWIGFVYSGDPNYLVDKIGATVPVPEWPKYQLPAPRNYVFTINQTLYTEPDTFRAEGINWLMDMMVASKNRNCTSIVACGGEADAINGETGGVYGF
ncbi:hypothetical protein ASPZODRAFT_110266 [Penicilliopsis zonata CBS 506.65]|uniref:Carboxylic ester hydrolase n=1 Tax=Penicilliopsis zonata CBS 506.65 TaxID=1073090 RepID=A0A1L9SSR4_9EURO|nr:hypothetical protein ASPZODRAFT_110266 [Penicilliopsis zonata CBS 506.65]OJJ50147.1 hypothetical protein ASPZODRAFT_110266 [Penicilliopsis zonata CBS 506.65]